MKLTRRQIAQALSVAPLTAAQQPATPAEDLDAAARARVKNTAAVLNAVNVPMSTEPAFQFKAL